MQLSQSRFSNTPTGRRPPSRCARSRAASPGGARSRASPSPSAGRDPRAAGAERRRQDHAPPRPGRPDRARQRQRSRARDDPTRNTRALRAASGSFPRATARFYLRLSGLENLRLLRAAARASARGGDAARATRCSEAVGLADAARRPRRRLLARDAEAALGRARAARPTRASCSSTRRRTTSTREAARAVRELVPRPRPTGRRGRLGDAAHRRDPRLRRAP